MPPVGREQEAYQYPHRRRRNSARRRDLDPQNCADSMPSSDEHPRYLLFDPRSGRRTNRRQLARDPDSLGTQPLDLLPHLGNRLGTAFDIRQLRCSYRACNASSSETEATRMLLLERIDAGPNGQSPVRAPAGADRHRSGRAPEAASEAMILQIERRRCAGAGIKLPRPEDRLPVMRPTDCFDALEPGQARPPRPPSKHRKPRYKQRCRVISDGMATARPDRLSSSSCSPLRQALQPHAAPPTGKATYSRSRPLSAGPDAASVVPARRSRTAAARRKRRRYSPGNCRRRSRHAVEQTRSGNRLSPSSRVWCCEWMSIKSDADRAQRRQLHGQVVHVSAALARRA